MFQPLVFNWSQGEFQQLPVGEKLALNSFTYVVRYDTPTLDWKIPHGLNVLLPNIPYNCLSQGQAFMVGVDADKSDLMQTTLHLTEPMSGVLYYALPDDSGSSTPAVSSTSSSTTP